MMSLDNESLYSPSTWCKRFPTSEKCLDYYVRLIERESELVRKEIPNELNVAYGTLEREKYDLFGIDLLDSAPIIFYVHGGYWQEESIGRQNASYIAKAFYKQGIKTFIVGYELCPKVQLEQICQGIQNVLKMCLNYAGAKGSSGIYLMGHSAGAQLVAGLFSDFVKTLPSEDNELLKAAFLVGGVYDLVPLLNTSYNTALKLTLETARALSPMLHRIHACITKFFVVVGRDDSPAFVAQSILYHDKLRSENVPSELFIFENIDHFNIMENVAMDNSDLTTLVFKIIKEIRK